MSIRHLVIVALLVAIGLAAKAQGQTPPPAAAPAKPGTLTGRITAADTGKPLRRAQILIVPVSRTTNVPPIAASTNSRGQYEAKNVPAGSYSVNVSRSGYVRLQYGQTRPTEQGLSVTVRAGDTTQNIDVALPRGAVLAGSIADELGEPYPGVRVDALALRYLHGKRQPAPVGVATTDDLGQFRIAGLEPGRYYVVASSTETWKTPKGEIWGYGSTYFPGGRLDQAQVVTLGVSEVKPDLAFALQPGRAVRVSGRLMRETGEPVAGASVPLLYSYPGVVMMGGARTTTTAADGTFELKNVTAGVYNLGPGSASEHVTVADGDIDGIVLTSKTGSTVTGQVVTDDGSAPPFGTSGVRVWLETPFDNVLPTVRVVGVDTDWSFKLTNVGGPFLFRLLGLPEDWMLFAVRLGDRDIVDTPWDVPTGGKEIGGLQIVVTRKVGHVSGVVLDASGKATAAATVVIFPEESELWIPSSRLIRAVRPEADGRFSISGLPAGTYRAVARALVDNGEWEDRAFLEAARDGGVSFVLAEGGTETISVKLPAPR